MKNEKFNPTFESLSKFKCPDWFRDAKFGIWSHCGPQSVPMCGDWYARHMYLQDYDQYNYHVRHYGHPSKFGYKDICKLWKAEKFEPEKLMDLYYKAGARYFISIAMHHDHFFNFPSKLNKFNSVEMGPGKDICGLWQAAAKKYNMPFGLTEHLGASFSWWRTNKGSDRYGLMKGVPYDGNDPDYKDFYFDNFEHANGDLGSINPWYTPNEKFREYWFNVMKELIDLYKPEMLYSDGALPFGRHWHFDDGSDADLSNCKWGLEAVAYLHNTVENAVYTQKSSQPDMHSVSILDVERSQLAGISDEPWQTDTCIGGWFYDAKLTLKKPDHVIEMLVDIISKNGTMLLNIPQRPDGTIDDDAVFVLEELGKWFVVCSEGVYSTRPWREFGEGDTKVLIDGFTENKTDWNSSDYRFTIKDNTLYAFMLKPSETRTAVIKSLTDSERVKRVRLLGVGEVPFSQEYGALVVKLPDKLPTEYVNCLALDLH